MSNVEMLQKTLSLRWDKMTEDYNNLSDILQSQNIDVQPLTNLIESTEAMCAVRATIIGMGVEACLI